MPLDLNRLRMSTALSDKDAYRYYRQITAIPAQPVAGHPKKMSIFRRTLKHRPLVVVSACLIGGLTVGVGLYKYRETPDNADAVNTTIDRVRKEFAEYEASLRRA